MAIMAITTRRNEMAATYDKEFRERAVRLGAEVGLKRATADLGIPSGTLYGWMQKAREMGDTAPSSSVRKTNDSREEEIKRLTKRLKEVEKANEILQDALAFFAVSRRK
jgi:transposase